MNRKTVAAAIAYLMALAVLAALFLAPAAQAATTAKPVPKPAAVKPAPLRKTLISTPEVYIAGYGAVWFNVSVRHLVAGRAMPSNLSPVYVQLWTVRGWVTIRTLRTGADGVAHALVKVPGGPQSLRAVRPVGATVTAATSPFVLVQVPDPAGEGPGASD